MVTSAIRHPLEILEEIEDSYEVDKKSLQEGQRSSYRESKRNTRTNKTDDLIRQRSLKSHKIAEPDLAQYSQQFKKTRKRICLYDSGEYCTGIEINEE